MTDNITITTADIVSVMELDGCMSVDEITDEVGYSIKRCGCCGKVTNKAERNSARAAVKNRLSSMIEENMIAGCPGFEYELVSKYKQPKD